MRGLSLPAGTFVCMTHAQLPTDGFYLPPPCSDAFADIDVETSHLDPGAGRVLQIGAVLVDRHGVAGEERTALVERGLHLRVVLPCQLAELSQAQSAEGAIQAG